MSKQRNNKGFIVQTVKHGIANRFPEKRIEIHEKLLQERYKPLLDEILQHEMSHTDKGYSSHDLWLDVTGFKNKALYHSFIIRTPSAWLQYSPLYKSQGLWYIDYSLFIFWGILLVACAYMGWLMV